MFLCRKEELKCYINAKECRLTTFCMLTFAFQVVKMLIIVVAMFGICWCPLHLFMLLLDFHPEIYQHVSMETLTTLFISFHWLAMSNSFANPIIYGFTNESFRVRSFYIYVLTCTFITLKTVIKRPAIIEYSCTRIINFTDE